MSIINKLINNGYQTEDIIELLAMYRTQVTEFTLDINCLSDEELKNKVHKLKGGAKLLCMDTHTLELNKLEDNLPAIDIDTTRRDAKEIASNILKTIDLLSRHLSVSGN